MGSSASCSDENATKVIEKDAENISAIKASRMLDDQRIVLDKREKFMMKKIQDEHDNITECMKVKNRQGKAKVISIKTFFLFLVYLH